jgi:hypothetical protein
MEQAPRPPVPKFRELLLVALLGAGLVAACSARSNSPGADVAASELPAFTADDSLLLDDSFSPEIFGAVVDSSDPLGARARRAEGIQLVRVATVTRDANGDRERYVVEVAPADSAAKGQGLSGPVTLTLEEANPSFAFVRSVDSDLVGTRLVLFFRRYNDGGRVMLHWHVEAANQRVQKAVENAKLMNEFGR